MKSKTIARTGKKVPISGQYRPSGCRREYTFVKNKTTPPNTCGRLQKFIMVDPTKHKK